MTEPNTPRSLSPAAASRQRRLAAREAARSPYGNEQTGDAYQLHLAALTEARQRLKDIQGIERKIEFKKNVLPEFMPYLQGVLESGQGAQDQVVATLMVWCLDIGDIETGIALARYMLEHNMASGDQYSRSTAALLVEETTDPLLRNGLTLRWKNGEIINMADANASHLAQLHTIEALTREHDMHDQIRAKLFKAIGCYLALSKQYAQAITAFERAVKLDINVGVKKHIERLTPLVQAST
ncbi:phage terminase small subunit [Teredinibacter turnerae]|uniref:phage terminase small subunit n=1 Tax=Teredinibacter turnerae TaxID=2426 RepID=UPI000361224E|nr:phage terminase small subunit [Teredinibacter turnerae]